MAMYRLRDLNDGQHWSHARVADLENEVWRGEDAHYIASFMCRSRAEIVSKAREAGPSPSKVAAMKRRKDPGPQPPKTFSGIPGAVKNPHPGFIPPQLATLRDQSPQGKNWIFEIKLDGYRLQMQRKNGKVAILTRSGLNWTNEFSQLESSAAMLASGNCIIDGEAVSADAQGRPNFSQLQADIADNRQDRMVYYAFDLLYLDGYDLRGAPLIERKRLLHELLKETQPRSIVFSEHFDVDGRHMFKMACEHRLEGIIAKRADAVYRSIRNEDWLKIKCAQTGKYVIVGYVPGGHGSGLGAIRLGRKQGKDLIYAGKTGTGFNARNTTGLIKKLKALEIPSPPLKMPKKKRDTKWVEPKLMAKIEYRDITDDGYVRHSSFKGLA
jgi:bifunctional non-homologous end joining protein LigD